MSTRVMLHDLDGEADLAAQWDALVARTERGRPNLLVLPELPFAPWLPAEPVVDAAAWERAAAAHAERLARFAELHADVVVTTRPVVDGDRRFNEAVVWAGGELATRRKTFLPDEPGFFEASWYDRGPVEFRPVDTPVGRLGVMICTELWFPEHARVLGAAGVGLLAVPRATPAAGHDRWEAGARVLASVAGAYCLSVNRAGGRGVATFDGGSVLVDPEARVLARTTPDTPCVEATIDLAAAVRARRTYPRYVDAS